MNAANSMQREHGTGEDSVLPRLGPFGVTSVHRISTVDRMIGARIGHLRVTGVLGSGGMGEVYRATDERLNRTVALKVIRAERRLSVDARGRFLREARTLSSLDHPNICRIHEYIEAEEGDFLVLELVDGVTLERAIELGMSRARKLRIAVEICDALAAAHRKGVVHRDLKEENIMIAADGAAKVLDFGIARHGSDDETPPPISIAEEPIEKAATLIFPVGGASVTPPEQMPRVVTEGGVAVGTPATMSPEQAIGGVATPASDMYSFGLLLQVLFTEKPVHPDYLGSRELMLRAAAGTTEPMLGQPRDITALVERLKRKAPADRPTAVETLEVLKGIVAAPKRRARMAMLIGLVVLLTAFGLKYVYDVTTARREAVARRRQAEELVNFMVGDLRTQLESAGRLELLDGAASKALAYFASFDPDELSGEDLRKNSIALAQLGEVRLNEGKPAQAVKLFEESVRFANAAVARDPKRDDWQLALSNAHFWLGNALRQQGDHEGTLSHFRTYLDISKNLAAAHPGDPKYEAEVSYGHGNMGAAYEAAGNPAGALAEYRTAVELDRKRVQREPANEKWRTDLVISLNRLGVVLQSSTDLAGAREAFREQLEMQRSLVAASPKDAPRKSRLATSLAFTGVLQQMMGDTEDALASFREELAIHTELAEHDPTNVLTQRNRASAQSRVAMLLANDTKRAAAMLEDAERTMRTIVSTDPRPTWRRDLAIILQRAAAIRLRSGDRRGARTGAQEAVALIEQVALEEPRNPQTTRALCEILLFAAETEAPNSSVATLYRSRVATLAAMERNDPRLTEYRARALVTLGRKAEAAPLIAELRGIGYRDGNIDRWPTGSPPGSPPPH